MREVNEGIHFLRRAPHRCLAGIPLFVPPIIVPIVGEMFKPLQRGSDKTSSEPTNGVTPVSLFVSNVSASKSTIWSMSSICLDRSKNERALILKLRWDHRLGQERGVLRKR